MLGPLGAAAIPGFVATVGIDVIVLGGVWLSLRPGPPDVRSKDELVRAVRGDRPTVVELYSNYCLICMANRQTLRLAATALGSAARFLRVELPTGGGREIGEAYDIRYTPSYLVFDGYGDVIWKVIPDNVTPLANGYRVLDGQGDLEKRLIRVSVDDLVAMVRTAA